MYYIFEDYESEEYIASKINYLINKEVTHYKNIDMRIKQLEDYYEIIYSDKQKEAIVKALENNILIITGGPGTGKTTIIKAIVDLYKMLNKLSVKDLVANIALLAPTGRASKRMSESTGYGASTIHRFLKWNKETNTFGVCENNKDKSRLEISISIKEEYRNKKIGKYSLKNIIDICFKNIEKHKYTITYHN